MSRTREIFCVLLLLAVQGGQLVRGAATDGLSYDELLYVASGYRMLALGDYRFGAEHPPLAQMIAAIPLIPLAPQARDLRGEEGAKGWQWANQFVFGDNASLPLLARARAPVMALGLGLSLLVWGWVREMAGRTAALVALALASFHPSFLAHGHLATTDMAATFAVIAVSWALWRWCERPAVARVLVVASLLGIAFATRLTAALLIPVIVAIVFLRWRDDSRPRIGARDLALLGGVCAVGSLLVIWAAYRFRYAAFPGDPEARIGAEIWAGVIGETPGKRFLDAIRELHIVPSAYWTSLHAYTIKSTVGHQNYLLGQVSAVGWWYYYLIVIAVKNTPGFLAALGLAIVSLRKSARDTAHWIVPAALMLIAASLSRVQVGDRYILPVYAYAIVGIATLAPTLLRDRRGPAVAIFLFLAHAIPSVAAGREGHLGYFNALVGRDLSHLVLSDSNGDWGQDLPRLAEWSRAHPDRRLLLAYWGNDDPNRYGLVREDLPSVAQYPTPARLPDPLAGWMAVSSTLVAGLYPPPGMVGGYSALQKRMPTERVGGFLIYELR